MSNIVETLQAIKPSLRQKKVIPTKAWSPFSLFKKMDKERLALKLASLSMIDSKVLEKKKEDYDKQIDNYMRQIKSYKKETKKLEEAIDHAKNSNKPDTKIKEIDRIMSNLLVTHFEFIEPAVTVFTTEFIKKGDRILGVFRIWIDWSLTDPSRAIKIINVYQRTPGYDHPCIQNGTLCMGNSRSVIEKHFKEKNIYILLETLIAFVVSENVRGGYISSWDSWTRQCRKLTKELTFRELSIRPNESINGISASRIMSEISDQLNTHSGAAASHTHSGNYTSLGGIN